MGVQRPKLITLIDNQPIADFCSEQELCFNYEWNLQLTKSGADGNPIINIESSNDGVNWDYYNGCAKDVLMDEDSLSFKDDMLPSKYFRVCVEANGTTTGNINAVIFLKGN